MYALFSYLDSELGAAIYQEYSAIYPLYTGKIIVEFDKPFSQ